MTLILKYFTLFAGLLYDMAPWLVLGFFIAGLMHIFVPAGRMNRFLGDSGFFSSIKAALIGIPLPLCSCGVIPTGVGLHKNGASRAASVSFLISTPQTGVDSILVTSSMLGLPFAIIRPVVAFVTGIFGGWLSHLLNPEKAETHEARTMNAEDAAVPRSFTELFRYAFVDFLGDIAKWLIVGLAVAAFIEMLVPDDFFSSVLGASSLQMLIMLIASVPMYVCATASVPIAAVLLTKGISAGAVLVFLMAGPATNAATITVIGRAMGKRTLYAYLASIIGGALLFGTAIDVLLPQAWFVTPLTHTLHSHQLLPEWLMMASGWFLLIASLNVFRLKWKRRHTQSIEKGLPDMALTTIQVNGMTCQHCKMNVEMNLKKLDFITGVTANPDTGRVEIEGENVDLNLVKETVEGIGYQYAGEK